MKVFLRFAVVILFVFIAACAQKSAPVASVNTKTSTGTSISSVSKTIVSATELNTGRALFINKCSDCHRLYQPGEYTRNQWETIFNTMFVKAKVDSAQQRLIRVYVLSES